MSVNKVNKTTGDLIPIAGQNMYSFAPIGTIVPFGGSIAPQGWLICNGNAISRTDYADLFAVIGTSFGSGNGSTTFNLPDLRETVPVGSGSRNVGITAHDIYDIGQFKDDQFQGHWHSGKQIADSGSTNFYKPNVTLNAKAADGSYIREPTTDGTNGTPRTGTTTHGKQLGVNYIIKATTEVVTDNSGKVNVSKMQSGTITIPTGSAGDVVSIPVSFGESFSNNNYIVELFNEGTAIVCNPSTKTATGFEAHVRYMTNVSSSYNIKYNAFQSYTDTTLKTVEALSPYSLNKSSNLGQFNRKFVYQGNSVSATMPHSGRLTLRLIKHGDGYSLYLNNQNNVLLDSYDNFYGDDTHATAITDTSITLQAWVKKGDVITLESNLPSNTAWADSFFLQTGLLLYNKDYD